MTSINQYVLYLLDQIKLVIVQMNNEQYATPLVVLNEASIGQHVRHTLEFFQRLDKSLSNGQLNYDLRNRDISLQENVDLAIDSLELLKGRIEANTQDKRLILSANYELENSNELKMETTYWRELAYNIEHAVHHMALIKIGLKTNFPNIVLPEHFGVASSTVRFYQQPSSF
ncbi:MAG: DinB family protein [Cyclobacteriaceae bacterium]